MKEQQHFRELLHSFHILKHYYIRAIETNGSQSQGLHPFLLSERGQMQRHAAKTL